MTLPVFVPAFAVLLYVHQRDRQNHIDGVKSKVLQMARLVAADETQLIWSTRLLLQHLAQVPEARVRNAGHRVQRAARVADQALSVLQQSRRH